MPGPLKPYYHSKWTCPFHGHYSARTVAPIDPDKNPVFCPECKPIFVSQLKGYTNQPVPSITKPRVPSKADATPHVSDKAPLRKRGRSH